MKKNLNKLIISVGGMFLLAIIAISIYLFLLSAPNKSSKEVVVTIAPGSITEIGKTLEKAGVIRNDHAFNVYMYTESDKNLKAGTYKLSQNLNVKEIVNILRKGSTYNPDEIKLTFKEGINIRKICKTISENTVNSYEDVLAKINNYEYIKTLISKYWFLTDDIINPNIYYPLEGYLFPNTYVFDNKNTTTEEIITKMLDEMDKQLTTYKDKLDASSLSIHKLITMASIIELEGKTSRDRPKVAGVFYNRLNAQMALGSDVTTYYAEKIDDWSKSLLSTQLANCNNSYNTRCRSYKGLPVGPIANPGSESLNAAINPENHDYYYFVADCQGKIYLSKNSTEHEKIISKLEQENNWCA